MFKVYDITLNCYKTFSTKEKLLYFLFNHKGGTINYYKDNPVYKDNLACNITDKVRENDNKVYLENGCISNVRYNYRLYIVYDSFDRIITQEIREELKDYVPKTPKVKYGWYTDRIFEFRKEPVPGIGRKYRYSKYFRHFPKRRNDWLWLDSWKEDFPNMPDVKERILMGSMWWDDFPPRGIQKSWKEHRKTQWKET